MKKIFMTLAVLFCCAVTTAMLTACGSKGNTAAENREEAPALVINLDSIVIEPYMAFGSSLADVEKYMNETHADWEVANPDTLDFLETVVGQLWSRYYTKDKMKEVFPDGATVGNVT